MIADCASAQPISEQQKAGERTQVGETQEQRETTGEGSPQSNGMKGFGLILAIYLLGLFIGGVYVGIVSPVRTVIQAGFGIDDATGIWMINIYTLFYAATIPTSGKLADRYGRKRVFTACVGLFCLGATLCGISGQAVGFPLLIVGRIIQAAGAGGMIPVATAEIGTSFPEEKRGMALGLAAAVAGIANVIGTVIGSGLLAVFGNANWPWIFYLCIPFGVLIVVGSLLVLPNHTGTPNGKLDFFGSALLTVFVLLLLFGLRDIDFTDIAHSAMQPQTWLPLLLAVLTIPLFRRVEGRADDPVFHMEYFSNPRIRINMLISLFIGATIITMVLVPEFAEYALELPTGSGGYYVAIIGIFAIAGPPLGGALIDRFGAKPILMAGLAVSVAGFLFVAFVTTANRDAVSLIVGLAIIGLGMGFTMGTPLNYMILQDTSPEDSSSAIATIALVRQIGTSIAPALLIAFIGSDASMAGFSNMFLCVAVFNVVSMIALCFYRDAKKVG